MEPTPANNGRRTSEVLRDFIASHPEPRVSIRDVRDALADRAFGALLVIFALPNLVPVNIPLLSAVLGLPLVLLAGQLMVGRHRPWFPDWLLRQSCSREGLESFVAHALPYLERAERLLRPRLALITSWPGERLIGGGLLVLTVVLALPIPLGNWLPAFAITIVGLALIEKDGLAVLAGFAVGIVSLFVAGAVVIGIVKATVHLVSALFT